MEEERKTMQIKLNYEIKEIEKVIKGKKKRGEDCKFEKELVASYRKFLNTTG